MGELSFTRAWSHFTVSVKLTPCACFAAQSSIAKKVRRADFSIQSKKKEYSSVNQKCDILSVQSTLNTQGELWRTCSIEVSLAARVERQGLEINTQCWVTASQLTWKINGRNILDYFIYCTWLGEKKKPHKNDTCQHLWRLSLCFSFLCSIMSGNFPPHSLAQFQHTTALMNGLELFL